MSEDGAVNVLLAGYKGIRKFQEKDVEEDFGKVKTRLKERCSGGRSLKQM